MTSAAPELCPPPPKVLLAVKDVRRAYGHTRALDGVSFELRAGEILALLGPNGAGKTTLLELLAGLAEPDSGEIETHLTPHCGIGYAPQSALVWRDLTLEEQMLFMAELCGLPPPTRAPRSSELLAKLGLSDRARSLAGTLSGGMQRRVGVALALIHDPKLVLLDEPTVGLDPDSRRLMHATLRELRTKGCAVLLSTHDMDEADRLSDRVAILDRGKLLAIGTARELKAYGPTSSAIELVLPHDVDRERVLSLLALGSPAAWNGDRLVIRVAKIAPEIVAILTKLSSVGIEPLEVITRERTLEDVFLERTGRSLRT